MFRIDSKPLKVCQNARANRCSMDKADISHAPTWGASQYMRYYGYKLNALCGIIGLVHSYDMTAANVHDIRYLKNMKWEYHDCTILGDKGYLSAPVQQDLFETVNITLEVPYRLNQKNRKKSSIAYKRFRKSIETVFSQWNDHLMMRPTQSNQKVSWLEWWQRLLHSRCYNISILSIKNLYDKLGMPYSNSSNRFIYIIVFYVHFLCGGGMCVHLKIN